MVLFFCAIQAWCTGYGTLAVILLYVVLALSFFFEEGRKEMNEDEDVQDYEHN